MFHDEVELILKSGKGGNGSASFRHEKYVPKGGPDGGDGGNGGNVYIVADPQMAELSDYASVHEFTADNGEDGSGRKMHGANGENLNLHVPLGTKVHIELADKTWTNAVDITRPDQERLLLRGGKGGRGNVHFATATHQTPKYAEPGEPAVARRVKLELQLIADIGLVGLPNAGKSTLLSVISDAKPAIGDYPFTTRYPVLGISDVDGQKLIIADIPGLIEGASEGKGLGDQFLRHISRTKVLLHCIDSLSEDYAKDYLTIDKELTAYSPELLTKPRLVVITKSELLSDRDDDLGSQIEALARVIKLPSALLMPPTISAATRDNLIPMLRKVSQLVGT